jgi:hypothetical protein
MMPALTILTLISTAIPAVPAGVYLWSPDPGRRRRAWRLLQFLRGR